MTTSSTSPLALHGGEKAITQPWPALSRWGEPEAAQLQEMLNQRSLFYWKGPQTTLLTERFTQHYPFSHVMPCSSGTAAIHIALLAAGIGPGDEVITSPITDMGTVIGILYQQGVPVFADLLPDTHNLDPNSVRQAITPKTKAIIAVHLTGNPCDMEALCAIAKEHGLVLIEDCAQAWGATWQGKPIGTIGDIGCYSLNDFKHIGCGDGGIVASNHPVYGPLLQMAGDKAYDRTAGVRKPESLAPNYRISEPQSAIAAAQMERMPAIVEKRNRLGSRLVERISGNPIFRPYRVEKGDFASFWFHLLRLDVERSAYTPAQFAEALRAEGLPCKEGYIACPVYQYPVFLNHNFFNGRWPIREQGLTTMDYNTVSCPVAEAILNDCIPIAINQAMDEGLIDQMTDALLKVATEATR